MIPGSNSWRTDLRRALERGDAAALTRIPKTDLHCHGMLSAPLDTYATILGRPLPAVPEMFSSFTAFSEYIVTHLFPALESVDGIRTLIRAAFQRMIDDGVIYAEMSFDLLLPESIGLRVAEFAELLAEECRHAAGHITVAPEIGIARMLPPDAVAPRLEEWMATRVCRSIDLYGDETLGAVRDFAPLYRRAADSGLKLKAHAGELCDAEAVRHSVEVLGLHAVQHGVRAAEDPAVTEFLAERGTVLHVCPSSNRALGICASLEEHPARQLFTRGVTITVNSDDFTLFGAGVSDELLNLTRMGFSPEEIEHIVDNGLREIPDR
jgi:adenosine deaminase